MAFEPHPLGVRCHFDLVGEPGRAEMAFEPHPSRVRCHFAQTLTIIDICAKLPCIDNHQ